MQVFVDVILPLAFEGQTFTYICDVDIVVGARVVVPFINKSLVGIVVKIHNQKPSFKLKKIDAILDSKPVMSQHQIEFLEWVAKYYMCPIGEVYRQTFPKGIRNASYKTPTCVAVALKNKNLEEVDALIAKRKAAKSTLSVLLKFGENAKVPKRKLIQNGATQAGINGLLKFGVVEIVEVPIKAFENEDQKQLNLNVVQKPTLIIGQHVEKLLDTIEQIMYQASQAGGVCLILCPNNFYAQRIAEMLDDEAIIEHHGKSSEKNRTENYLRILNAPSSVRAVVGTKQALLLPYQNLAQVVVLDEASHSYKSDRAPRMHARDCAMMLASIHSANVTLTAIVPSVEAYANAKFNRTKLLDKRRIDAKIMILEKGKESIFSKYMLKRIEETLEQKNQVIVFQNRRGFAGSIVCKQCGFTPTCPHCNVTLTLHQTTAALICHHCEYAIRAVNRCPACASVDLATNGMGTERVEEELNYIFPDAKIARVDTDTVARKDAFGEVKEDIESAQCEIIVATQIILGGLKIPKAALCVVVNADNMFISTDFRTSEKIISTLVQLRNMVSEELIIQATQSQNPILKKLEQDYLKFFDEELEQRKEHNYPPFVRLITIRLYHDNPRTLQTAALELDEALLPVFGNRLTSPYEPIGDRKIQGNFVLELMLRLKRDAELENNKAKLDNTLKIFLKRNPQIKFTLDVDPL